MKRRDTFKALFGAVAGGSAAKFLKPKQANKPAPPPKPPDEPGYVWEFWECDICGGEWRKRETPEWPVLKSNGGSYGDLVINSPRSRATDILFSLPSGETRSVCIACVFRLIDRAAESYSGYSRQ